jgi:hypothetical protein
MDNTSLSLILAVLFGWWLVTVALATDSFKSQKASSFPPRQGCGAPALKPAGQSLIRSLRP